MENLAIINRQDIKNAYFKRPEMVFQIEKDHFELNFQGQEAGFQLDGGYYKKTVSEDDLVVGFDDDNMVSKDIRSLYYNRLLRHF